MAVEGEHDGLEALGGRQGSHSRYHRLVTEVHAVIGTDGYGAGSNGSGARPVAVDHLHVVTLRMALGSDQLA